MTIELTEKELSCVVGGEASNTEEPTKQVPVPAGSCLSVVANQNFNYLFELLNLNPQYKANPDYVQAGALVLVYDRTQWPD